MRRDFHDCGKNNHGFVSEAIPGCCLTVTVGVRDTLPGPRASAPSPLEASTTLLLMAIVGDALLSLFLYLRPSPLGAPFALDPAHYVFHALFYGAWGQVITALPFLLRALRWPGRGDRLALVAQLCTTATLLCLGALDREFQRFLGMHVTRAWLGTYGAVHRTPDVIWSALARDQGGAWSSLLGIAVPILFLLVAPVLAGRVRYDVFRRRNSMIALTAALLVPAIFWNVVPGGKSRQAKVRPAVLTATGELMTSSPEPLDPRRRQQAIETFQRHFVEQSGPSWRFVDPAYPLQKHYVGTLPVNAGTRPNIIVLSLETFRARDIKTMNPALSGPAPTPFLDALASDTRSAYWPRYYASGIPTVHAFMAIHASLMMHPSRSIPAEGTGDRIDGFPAALRAHGYHTLHFTGSDPDWDSQRVWLSRWYDEVDYGPSDHERDRLTFRRAARRIREVGREGGPFLAYLSSISNHTPFHSPEPELALSDGDSAVDALHNTMHYTDDVVRELYTSLQSEPWFDNTIWIITGDHAFDLGDRGESGGHDNLRHETTWVPLIIHGRDARLPRGAQPCVGSHLDIAPTVAELSYVWDDNSYMGHSLLHKDCAQADAVIARRDNYAYETAQFSLFKPADAQAIVYRGGDLLQQRALKQAPASLLARAEQLRSAYQDLTRYVVDEDRVVRRPATAMAPRDLRRHVAKALLLRASTED
jgi:arylsulfatase A-like enzyme